MKIISIRQPWASLIVSGAKDVENRTWPTRYRGPVLVHASQRADSVTERADLIIAPCERLSAARGENLRLERYEAPCETRPNLLHSG
jgi:ASCH domain-containing protein